MGERKRFAPLELEFTEYVRFYKHFAATRLRENSLAP